MPDRSSAPVVVRLSGRLGNQLFHFAVCRAAQRSPGPTLIDQRMLSRKRRGILHECLRADAIAEVSQRDLFRLRQTPRVSLASRRIDKFRDYLPAAFRDRYVFRENVGHGYDARIETVSSPVLLSGYFNDERYFTSAAADIRAAFRPASATSAAWVRECQARAAGRPLVAVGFRHASDYETLGWTLPHSYYRDAVEAAGLTGPCYAVFGDARAPNMAAAERVYGPDALVGAAHHLSVVDQLNAMAQFDTLIIPNSTFSWWGAWLADFDRDYQATVIAPDPWVYLDNELIPDRWTKVAREGGLVRENAGPSSL